MPSGVHTLGKTVSLSYWQDFARVVLPATIAQSKPNTVGLYIRGITRGSYLVLFPLALRLIMVEVFPVPSSQGQKIPPFPDDVPTHSLLVIDYERLKRGEMAEKVLLP